VKTVFVMVGLPGSGKSSLVQGLIRSMGLTYGRDVVVCSADSFYLRADGTYDFDGASLGAAHSYCKARFSLALGQESVQYVFVDNTNLRRRDREWYVRVAEGCGWRVAFVPVGNPLDPSTWAECAARNIHGVPLETVKRMAESYDPIGGET